MKDTKKPKIRFKEFNDSWEQRKVSDIANRYDNLRIPVAANLRIPGVTPYYGANGIQDYVDGFTHEGEFVLVAEDGANDLKNYPVKCVNGRIWVNNHAHVLQSKPEMADNKFLAYSISQADIEALLVGGGRSKLNAEVMMSIELVMPSLPEQIAIGRCMTRLDYLITLHQRECEKLLCFKKSMLEKMFPKNGEKYPEIRFSCFTDSWEQRKLSDEVSSIDTGKSKFDAKESGDYEILGSTGVIGYDDSFDYEGDFLLTARVGANAGTLYRHLGKVKITDNTVFLQGSHIDFVFYLLDKFDLKKMSFGSGQPLIKASELKCLELMMPVQNEEKEKIATYFLNLYNLITLHQREVDKLAKLKKSMLEKMFV